MNEKKFLKLLTKDSSQKKYFEILLDKEEHCRKCAQEKVKSEQLAGGGGVQGLKRGTYKRPGIIIETEKKYCEICGKKTNWDRWTGEFKTSTNASALPKQLIKRILEYYDYKDVIECRKRPENELVIDHRFPMIRYNRPEKRNKVDMSDKKIYEKFQLLKKDNSGNYNLLKSRACEKCMENNKRGCPFGIEFYYKGTSEWPSDIPKMGSKAKKGCVGCGWYNFEKWKKALNKKLKNNIY